MSVLVEAVGVVSDEIKRKDVDGEVMEMSGYKAGTKKKRRRSMSGDVGGF